MNLKAQLAILAVIIGCWSNVVFLELLVKEDPGCGNLITFSSFLFISIEGFLFTTKCGTLTPKVPFRSWTYLVLMYFVVSVTNNYALNFNISMPLHMIFRAGSLMANMVLGMIILGKRYTRTKYLSVIMISVGIATCTIMSSQDVKKSAAAASVQSSSDNATEQEEGLDELNDENNEVMGEADPWEFFEWTIGISMLTFALFVSARMGIYQEVIYGKYGKHPREALFYSHCLPLPGFLLLSSNIYSHFLIALNSAPLFSVFGFPVPIMIFHLVCNVLTQYLCISAVFVLTSECASLTVTLVVTLRKFISLLFSIWYFENPFTLIHWFGTFCVFAGTLMFSDIVGMTKDALRTKRERPKVE